MDIDAHLILDDGSAWPGRSFGADAPRPEDLVRGSVDTAFDGEVIFNTGMTGYHEILTDPSYTGQIVLMTSAHIGNYGTDDAWSEIGPVSGRSRGPSITARGLVVRNLYDGPVPGGRGTLDEALRRSGVCGLANADTRGLTLKLRREGSRNGVILRTGAEPTTAQRDAVTAYLDTMPSMAGRDLTGDVGTVVVVEFDGTGPHVVLVDCGVKMNILRELRARGCRVSVVPSGTTAPEIRALNPDAILFSNGPGDPEPLDGPAELARSFLGQVPLWGICLGHQILARAVGARTYKMSFGHHGINHPVTDERSGRVFVTSQNHGFAVEESSLPEGCRVRFRNANDGSVEGIEDASRRLICVQHHPEAAPGPVDSSWIFDAFLAALEN